MTTRDILISCQLLKIRFYIESEFLDSLEEWENLATLRWHSLLLPVSWSYLDGLCPCLPLACSFTHGASMALFVLEFKAPCSVKVGHHNCKEYIHFFCESY